MTPQTTEAYYDTVPRAVGTIEEVGPFTLFLAAEDIGWPFYARPRLGGPDQLTADDVRRVLARQAELGRPRAIEWVDEATPSLLPGVRAAGHDEGGVLGGVVGRTTRWDRLHPRGPR